MLRSDEREVHMTIQEAITLATDSTEIGNTSLAAALDEAVNLTRRTAATGACIELWVDAEPDWEQADAEPDWEQLSNSPLGKAQHSITAACEAVDALQDRPDVAEVRRLLGEAFDRLGNIVAGSPRDVAEGGEGTLVLTFSRSAACAQSHDLMEDDLTVELPSDGKPWVQLTYESIRDHDGGFVAHIHQGCWWFRNLPWSDVLISHEARLGTGQ